MARVARLAPELARIMGSLTDHPLVTEVRGGVGLISGIQMVPEVNGDRLMRDCIEAGVVVRILGGNVVQISPPFVIDEDELQTIADAIRGALDNQQG